MTDASDSATMTGAQALVRTLADCGVTACFANPGTSEMHLVTALDGEPRIRTSLCLFEGVATGAADGFARMSGTPAMTLLHLGPGYLNGGANIHNARRAYAPMINVIGDHAVHHQNLDAPLASNIVGLAGPNSKWIRSADAAEDAGRMAAEAYAATCAPSQGPVSLILPADTAWNEGGKVAEKPPIAEFRTPDAKLIEQAVVAVKAASKPVILVNGSGLHADGLKHAARLEAAGIRVLTDTFFIRQARGAGHFAPGRMQYFAEMALDDLQGSDLMLVAGTKPPVAFFAYPNTPSELTPEGCESLVLGGPDYDSAAILKKLADALGASEQAAALPRQSPDMPTGPLTSGAVGASVCRHMPAGAMISDDGVTGSLGVYLSTLTAESHEWMCQTGGAIGIGMPLAIGAAMAKPDSKSICLSGDGSGMYTIQSLWTMARENLDVTTIVFVNHSYRILNIELARTGAGNPGPTAANMLSLGTPEIDWVQLSEAQGVPAIACETAEEFDAAFEKAMSEKGPRLIAAIVNE